jgi:predicted nucleotidyltransferase
MTAMDAEREIGEALADALRGTPGLVSVYLFGSVAEGRAHRESDVDLGLLLDRAAYPTPQSRFDVRLRLAGTLPAVARRDADIVILNDAPPTLARRILVDGRCLLLADRDADRAFLRTTLSRAADLQPFLRRMRQIKLAALER